MKRLYLGLAVRSKENNIQLVMRRIVASSEGEARGILVDTAMSRFPNHALLKLFLDKVLMNDLLEILEKIDINQYQANYIKETLKEKGF